MHDSVGKALRTPMQPRSRDYPGLKPHTMASAEPFYNSIHWPAHFPIFGNPCPQSIIITTYQSAYILWRAVGNRSIFPTKTHSSKTHYTTGGHSGTAFVTELRYVYHA